jgi:hypothetical protein
VDVGADDVDGRAENTGVGLDIGDGLRGGDGARVAGGTREARASMIREARVPASTAPLKIASLPTTTISTLSQLPGPQPTTTST